MKEQLIFISLAIVQPLFLSSAFHESGLLKQFDAGTVSRSNIAVQLMEVKHLKAIGAHGLKSFPGIAQTRTTVVWIEVEEVNCADGSVLDPQLDHHPELLDLVNIFTCMLKVLFQDIPGEGGQGTTYLPDSWLVFPQI